MESSSTQESNPKTPWRWILAITAVFIIALVIVLSVLRNTLNFNWLDSQYWTGIQGIAAIFAMAVAVYEIVGRNREPRAAPHQIGSLSTPAAAEIDAPPPPASFVDRVEVIRDVVAFLIGRDGVKALALEGFGGLGKSSVAQKVVEELRTKYQNRFRVISWHQCDEIRGVDGWARLLDEVARRHGHSDLTTYADVQAKEGRVTELLAGKDSLLILDNVEERFPFDRAMRVLTVRGKNGIGPSLLVTSRYAFTHPNLQGIELGVLPVTDGDKLFCQRVVSISGGRVQITPSELGDVKRVCQDVGYLPLGIELTAAVVARRMVTVSALAQRLANNSTIDTTDTFQRLSATFSASYDPLSFGQRYAFVGFSFLDGADFSIEAAQQIAGTAQKLAPQPEGGALQALFEHSLVQSFELQDDLRCRLHPLLKQFAAQKRHELPESVQSQLANAVVEYFAAGAESEVERERARDRDYLNYVGAISLAYDQQSWLAVIRLCEMMGNYWYISGQWYEGRKYLQLGVSAAQNLGAKRNESRFLVEVGRIAEEQGDVTDSKESLQRALVLLQEIELTDKGTEVQRGIVDTLLELGRLNDKQGNYDPLNRFEQNSDTTAKEWFIECLERAIACSYPRLQGSALHELGVVSIHVGDYDDAFSWLTQALDVRTANNDRRGIGRTNHQFGRMYNRKAEAARKMGDEKQADQYTALASEHLNKALSIAQEEGDSRGYSHTLREVGILQRRIGQRDAAQQSLNEALIITNRLGDKLAEGQIHEELCKLALDEGQGDVAAKEAQQGYALLQAANARPQLAKITDLMLQHGWPVPGGNTA